MFDISYLQINQANIDFKRRLEKKWLVLTSEVSEHSQRLPEIQNVENSDNEPRIFLGFKRKYNSQLEGLAILKVLPNNNIASVSLISEAFLDEESYLQLIKTLSFFVFNLFPSYDIEINPIVKNPVSASKLETVGFCIHKKESPGEVSLHTRKSIYSKNLEFLRKSNLHIVASDAGGAFQISALLREMSLSASASLQGPALGIFQDRNPKITITTITDAELSGKKILFGSGFYGGFESSVLENPNLKANTKVVFLDHWMNFRSRFNPSNPIFPETFLVTNELAYEKAKSAFPAVPAIRVPDFLLAEYRRHFLASPRQLSTVLLLLEPDAKIGEGLKFPIGELENYFRIIESFARLNQISTIVVRKHPSQVKEKISYTMTPASEITWVISEAASLVEDLLCAYAVFGFHSYALYASSMLGVETFGFFADEKDHWTHSFPLIKRVI